MAVETRIITALSGSIRIFVCNIREAIVLHLKNNE